MTLLYIMTYYIFVRKIVMNLLGHAFGVQDVES